MFGEKIPEDIIKYSEFWYNSQGYVDVPSVAKHLGGAPEELVENILSQNGYVRSGNPKQWIKECHYG